MNEEKMRVLKMIQEGKLTPEEGMQLLDLLEEGTPSEANPRAARAEKAPARTEGGRWFHVRVTDLDTGKVRTNVRIPLGIVSMGIKMGARFAPQVEGLEMDKLNEFITEGVTGQLVDVTDDEDGEHVEVYIE
jgi:hypothetical protein